MPSDSEFYEQAVGRRTILSGAIAGLALGCAGCSASDAVGLSNDVVATDVPKDVPDSGAAVGPDGDGFGLLIDITSLDTFHAEVEANGGFLYAPFARAWLVSYPDAFIPKALKIYPEALHDGLEVGVLALYQKCPHLGCRVPECASSQQFECPCHGSMYSHYGEHIGGPAPRGMDLFPVSVEGGLVRVDTSTVVDGLPLGTDITGWKAAGPRCIGELEAEIES